MALTPEEKAKLEEMTDEELYQFTLNTLIKAEAMLLLERSLERLKPQAIPKLEKVLAAVQESKRLIYQIKGRY